ncbi:DUF2118 domain-containing protein [Tepidimicrobium xylanilyticum]|uniref:DUF2118 domain-containing protein n=1 Tax=Tepidimicrobium xylanilyticum TaxID=1123352 RepID=UPI00265630CD|nr:DUF2118 domain-containing protein [Tepidimicrobium xylanilyticum]GMG97586.1 acetyl-CoA carboxylase biotin carboxyl carrier protein subunit [Tepidimicrobium xylanilyticum]
MRKFLIKVNGNQYEVEVEEIKGDITQAPTPQQNIQPTPQSAPQSVQPTVSPKTEEPKVEKEIAVQEGEEVVEAPMPGTILSINVKEGDTVKEGQILAILEAMKMENEILAPRDGKVKAIITTKGASVNTGDKLIVLE